LSHIFNSSGNLTANVGRFRAPSIEAPLSKRSRENPLDRDAIKHRDTNIAPCFIACKHRAALFFGMARNEPQMNLRLPADLKEQIEEAAEQNNRSLTSEVVARLRASFEPPSDALDSDDALDRLAAKLAKKLAAIQRKK
jgi:hypothetical protein